MSPWPVQRGWTVDGAPLNPHSDSRQQVVVKPVACWDGSGEGQALEGSLAGGTVGHRDHHLLSSHTTTAFKASGRGGGDGS